MALQYSDSGEVSALLLPQPEAPVVKGPAKVESFLDFAAHHALKGLPEDLDFCPIRATAIIVDCLQKVHAALGLCLLCTHTCLRSIC